MNAAPRSSRVVTNRIDESARASITSRVSSPGSPKTYSTPSFSRQATSSCATVRIWMKPSLGRGSGDLDHLLAHGVHDRLHARVEVQLLEDVPDMVLDRVLGDVELLRDVA